MAETEESVLNFQIFTDIQDTRDKIALVKKAIKELQDQVVSSSQQTKAFSEQQQKDYDKLAKNLESLQKFYSAGSTKNIRSVMNLLSGRTADGKFASHGKWIASLSENMKAVGQVTATVRQEAEGLAAALQRAQMQGQNLKQIFGTDWGQASTRIRQAKDYIDRQAEVAHWNEDAYRWYANFRQAKFYTLNGTKTGQTYKDRQLQVNYWQQQAYNDNYNPDRKRNYVYAKARDKANKEAEFIRQSNLTEEEKAAERLAERQKNLQDRLGTTQLMVMSNYWVINRLAGAYKALINYTVQYDEELHQLQAISAMSNSSLDKTRQTIEAVAVSTEFTSLELAKASTVLAQAGLSATQIQSTLPAIAKLATATGTDLNTATDTITSTMNVYNLQLSEAERVTNALTTAMNESKATIPSFQTAIQYAGNFASQLGMSFEETAAAISAATQAGIRSKSMLGTGMRAVLTEFLKPTDKLVAQLQAVGLTVDDIDVKTKGYVNVLKTLKSAGFGAAEAFKGMERRGAAFLAAQINQTDFMDNLRLQMAGSAAAAKANETQMEALAKQIKNFENVLGTAGTKGLTPFISLLSNLLRIVNEFSQTGLGGGLFSVLLTGGGVFASLKSWQMAWGSFTGILKGLGMLTNARPAFSLLKEFVKAGGPENASNWAKMVFNIKAFIGSITGTGWVAIIAAAVSAIYQLGDALDLWTSKNEKVLQQLEEAKGKRDELQEEVSVIDTFMGRLVTERQKLESVTERRILSREIMTRIPETTKYLNGLTDSLEDIYRALIKIRGVKTGEIADKSVEIAENSYARVVDAAKTDISSRTTFWGNFKDREDERKFYDDLLRTSQKWQQAGLGNELSLAGLWNAQMNRKQRGLQRSSSIYQELEASKVSTDTAALEAFRTSGMSFEEINKELALYLSAWLNYTKKASASTEEFVEKTDKVTASMMGENIIAGLASAVNEMRRVMVESDTIKIAQEAAQDLSVTMLEYKTKSQELISNIDKDLKYYSILGKNPNGLDNESYQGLVNLATPLINQMDTAKTLANYGSLVASGKPEDLDKLRTAVLSLIPKEEQTTNLLDKLNNKDYLSEYAKHFADTGLMDFLEVSMQQLNRIVEIALSSGKIIPGVGADMLRENAKTLRKTATNTKSATIIQSAKEGETKATNLAFDLDIQQVSESVDLTQEQITKAVESLESQRKAAVEDINTSYERLLSKLQSPGANRIDALTLEINQFFNALDEGVKKISTTYREAIKPLEQQLARQEGVIAASSQYYGGSNPIVAYENVRKKRMEEGQNTAYITALETQLEALQGQRMALRESPMTKRIYEEARQYQDNFKRYQGLAQAGQYGEALKLQKQLDKVSSSAKKLATKDDELTKAINEVQEELEKRRTWRETMESYSNLSVGEQLGKGMEAATGNYVNDVREQGLHTLAGSTAYLASGVIDEIDSGFTTMFTDIISNSKSAGDAFKDFGRQVLTTIRDIAIQMAVKQGMSALFSSFGSSFGAQSPTEGQLVIGGTYSTGGPVIGPVKNRDSVNARLMPGEYVLKKSAVDVIGRDYLDSLNSNAAATLNASAVDVNNSREASNSDSSTSSSGGTVNVYVVGQEQQQAMTPSDVLVTITQDMLTGGQTKRLVKSIAMGAI